MMRVIEMPVWCEPGLCKCERFSASQKRQLPRFYAVDWAEMKALE